MSENPYETPQIAPETLKKAPWWVRIVSTVLMTMSAVVFILVGLAALGATVDPDVIRDREGFFVCELCCSFVALIWLAIGVWIRVRWRTPQAARES